MTDSEPTAETAQRLIERWQQSGDVDALDELLRSEVQALAVRLRSRGRGLLSPSASASDLWDPLESTCRHASLSIL